MDKGCTTLDNAVDFACSGASPITYQCRTAPVFRVVLYSKSTCGPAEQTSTTTVPLGICATADGAQHYKLRKMLLGATPQSLKTVYSFATYPTLLDCKMDVHHVSETVYAGVNVCKTLGASFVKVVPWS